MLFSIWRFFVIAVYAASTLPVYAKSSEESVAVESTAEVAYDTEQEPDAESKEESKEEPTEILTEELSADTASGDVAIDETNFTDVNFRNYVSTNFDTDGNNKLNQNERNAVTKIDISGRTISSVKGIEYFTKLEELYCISDSLTSLDVSKNTALVELSCSDNQLTSLNVRKNTALTKLNCSTNHLTSLDVSKNTNLDSNYTSLSSQICNYLETADHEFDFSTIPNIDVNRITNLSGGTISGNILSVTSTDRVVTYTYDCGTDKNGNTKTMDVTMTITVPVSKLTLNKSSITVNVGSTTTLTPTITPDNASNKNVSWTSSNTKVAFVSQKGVVKGVAAGTATITCTAADGSKVKAACKITVTKPVTKIKLNKSSATIKQDKTVTLTATIAPSNATNKNVTWKSSDTSIATVSSKGVVTAKKAGTVTITCTAADGSKVKATCKVTVTK